MRETSETDEVFPHAYRRGIPRVASDASDPMCQSPADAALMVRS